MKLGALTLLLVLLLPVAAAAQEQAAPPAGDDATTIKLPQIQTQEGASGTVKWIVIVTLLSLAPAILVLVTSFTRIIVVLSLLRQGLGSQQLPPNQVLFGLALLMTAVVMTPVYNKVHDAAIKPYTAGEMEQSAAIDAGTAPVRDFMIKQLEAAGNADYVDLFLGDELREKENLTWREVPTPSLIAAFAVSELKVAFMMGFRILLPFLVIDMLIASLLTSMGMLMLPPVLISLPFKLLLFVLADGWYLVVGTLMRSFG